MSSASEEWDTLEDAMGDKLVITDVAFVSDKKKPPSDYEVIENTHDGKKANFPEGKLGLSTRYLCYTRKQVSQRGFVVVSDMKVQPVSDRAPLGYLPVNNNYDDGNKTFSQKQLLVRFSAPEQAQEAVSDVVILSAHKKEDVPSGFKRLPEINGFSICFKLGPVPKKKSNKQANTPALTVPGSTKETVETISRVGSVFASKKIRSAIDGIQFTIPSDYDMQHHIVQFALGDFKFLTLQEIEDKYDYDFSRWQSLAS